MRERWLVRVVQNMCERRMGLVTQNVSERRLGLVIQNMRERSVRFHRQNLSVTVRAAADDGYRLSPAPLALGHQNLTLLDENPVELLSRVLGHQPVVLHPVSLAFPGEAGLRHDEDIAGQFEHGHQGALAGFAEFYVQDRLGGPQDVIPGGVLEKGHKQHDAAADFHAVVLGHREPRFETLLNDDPAAHSGGCSATVARGELSDSLIQAWVLVSRDSKHTEQRS
ncbi:unnamed protein product [Ixodes pacificus]